MSDREKSSRYGLLGIVVFLLIAGLLLFVLRHDEPDGSDEPESAGEVAETRVGAEEASGDSTSTARTLLGGSPAAAPAPYVPPRTNSTAPDRSGRIAPLVGPADGEFEPLELALGFLRDGSPELPVVSGYNEIDFAEPRVMSENTSRKSGVTAIHLRQTLDGIDIYNADLNINVAKDGSILSASNGFLRNAAAAANRSEPLIDAEEAIAAAAQHVAVAHERGSLTRLREPEGPSRETIYEGGDLSRDSIPAKLVYVATGQDELKLAWNLVLHLKDGVRWLDLNIDAETGDLLAQANWYANAEYRVYAQPKEHPGDGGRTLESDPHDPSASPFGWHDTNGATGPEHTDTRGNNVWAQEDTNADNSGGRRPSGGPALSFDFPISLTLPPQTYESAAVANLFYWNNLIHDVLWHHGFDESAGNFQRNNYSRGGLGGDPVQADAQDGSGFNNANFGTPPEGQEPRMQMFVWTETNPYRDSDLDNGVIIHEYGHGLSNRLTGGPANSSALIQSQSRGMGEGWSDWLALVLTAVPTDTGATPRGIGTYVLGQATTGPGIRPYRYSTDLVVNPQTFGNIRSGLSVPHGIGSVWCTTIWEVYWELVAAHGFDPDLRSSTSGNGMALDLIIEGMKLQPANPTYLDARDAILLADQTLNGGTNLGIIWRAFAKRGMGFSALDGGSASSLNVTEAFDLPNESLLIDDVTLSETNSGQIQATFTVSLDSISEDEVRVDWSTADGSATGGSDFAISSGTLVFPTGTTSRTVDVPVNGDTLPEEDEEFFVRLSNPINAVLSSKREGIATISNDDYIPPVIDSSLSVVAIEDFEFRYRIGAANTPRSFSLIGPPAGMGVDSVTGEIVWTPSSEGIATVDIVATNPAGSDTATLSIDVLENSLQNAIDVHEDVTIFHSPVPWRLQTSETRDGRDAAQSGEISHDEFSTFLIKVDGPETLTFWWKVSSEENYDFLQFIVDGEVIEEIHGQTEWQQVQYEFPASAREYNVSWSYVKDFSVDIGADAGWVDNIVLRNQDPRPFVTGPLTAVGVLGEPFEFQVETTRPADSFAATGLPPGFSIHPTTGLITGNPTEGGTTPIQVTVGNGSGETAENIEILIFELVDLPFSDNFESGVIGSHWAVTGTSTHRTQATQEGDPRGSWHAMMDSSIDQSYARNEMTLYADLRGLHDVQLTFWAKDFNDEIDGPPPSPFMEGADFDGIAISSDQIHWYEIQPLRTEIFGSYRQFTVDIDQEMRNLGIAYSDIIGIRFNHYDNYEFPVDGFAIDDVSLTGSPSTLGPPVLTSSSDLGASNSDALTSDDTPAFSLTATAGAPVALISDRDGVVAYDTTNSTNRTIATDPLSDGTHSITAQINGGPVTGPAAVTIDTQRPVPTVTKANGQADPASSGPVEFDITFSRPVSGFDKDDLLVEGANVSSATLLGGPTDFHVSIPITITEGSVSVTVPADVSEDVAGNGNLTSTSSDNRVEIDGHGGDAGSATLVPLISGDGQESGYLSDSDTDVFEFSINNPRQLGIFTTGNVDTRGELRDSEGNLLNDPSADDQAGGGSNFYILETIPGGTYFVHVAASSGSGDYHFRIVELGVPGIQPDVIVAGRGNDVYGQLAGQTLQLVSRRGRVSRATTRIQNDGDTGDDMTITASPGNRVFRVSYTDTEAGNVTAAMLTGSHRTGNLAPGDDRSITTTVSPNRRLISKRVRKRLPSGRVRTRLRYFVRNYATTIRATSGLVDTVSDLGSIRVRTTK